MLGRIAIVLVARIGEGFLRDLRNRLFGHMMSLSLDYFETEKTGKIVARMTSDIDAMEELVSQGLVLFVQNTFVFVGAVTVVLIVSWQLALGILVIVPPVYFGSRWFRRVSNKAYLEVRDTISTNLSTLQESLEGVRVVQAFGREDAFTRKFHRTNEDQYHANMHTVRISSKYFPIIEYAGVVGTAVIIGYGGWLTTRGVVTVGTVAAFVLWLNSLFEPINQLSQLYNTVQSSAAALAKIFGVLDTRPDRAPAARPRSTSRGRARSTSTTSRSRTARTSRCCTTCRCASPTASGSRSSARPARASRRSPSSSPASTTRSRARCGSAASTSATRSSCRCAGASSSCPQEGFLFAGTLRDNVRVGRPEATDAEVEEALRVLGLLDRFAAFPEGLETEVRERGSRLSAGERQLVSLARAALADPSVLDPRRGDVEPRPRHRARGRAGARDA